MIKSYLTYRLKRKSISQMEGGVTKMLLKNILAEINTHNDGDVLGLIQDLKADNRLINVTDLGAGSRLSNAPKRSVKSILKSAVSKPKQVKLIAKIISFYKINNVLELGTSLGISAAFLAKNNPLTNIYTIEGCPNISKIASENFKKLNLNNVHQFTGEFSTELSKLLPLIDQPELVFIDGNHTYHATIDYFNLFIIKASNKSILVFDDIHWSKGMEKAWQEIITNKSSILTLDFFDFGIVFLDENLPKEHHVLGY